MVTFLWIAAAFFGLMWVREVRVGWRLQAEADEAREETQQAEQMRRQYQTSVEHERRRADANFDEVKRLTRELDIERKVTAETARVLNLELTEANRKLGFVRRALDGFPPITIPNIEGEIKLTYTEEGAKTLREMFEATPVKPE